MKKKIPRDKRKKSIVLFRRKMGMETFTALTAAILMAITIIIFIFILMKIRATAEEQALNTRCQKSVVSYARLKKLPVPSFMSGGVAREENIDCPTQYLVIKKGSPNDQRKQIAELMKQCWYNFGEGKQVLFSEGKKFCHICGLLQFEDKEAALAEFPYFTMTQKINFKRDDRYPSYYEYFTDNIPTDKLLEDIRSKDNSAILGSQRYAVVFTYFKKESPSFWAKLGAGALIGLAAGLAIGITIVTGGLGGAVIAAKIGAAASLGFFSLGAVGAYMTSDPTTPQAVVSLTPYNTEKLKSIGCQELPVSQMDKRFR